jgi:methylphosphotriester-DNA--protein-cysteine methyltransferase
MAGELVGIKFARTRICDNHKTARASHVEVILFFTSKQQWNQESFEACRRAQLID